MDKRLAVRNMCIIELLFCLGLRVGELSALDMADYWPEENTVLIRGKGRRRVIEEDNQLYNRARLCQPQQQKIPCKEYRSETESLECGILQSGYSRNIP